MGRSPFSVVLHLNGGQNVTPVFMKYGTIVLMIVLQIIPYGCGESALICKSNNIFDKLFVADVPAI